MEYVVFDLEFNQGFNRSKNKTISDERCPFEIIQIGAIKLDSSFNIIDTFDSFVKPTIYKSIHPYIGKMTGITMADVANAPTFINVYKEFKKFISSSKKTVLCVWGTADLKELYRNITYFGLPNKNLPKHYINVQSYASKYFDLPSGKSIGLRKASENLDLDTNKSFHNAFNDAYYTAQVFMRIDNCSIVPDVYSYTTVKPKSSRKPSKKITDFDAVYNELENNLGRELTKEDKNLVYLSYNMGKNNSFSIDKDNIGYKKR